MLLYVSLYSLLLKLNNWPKLSRFISRKLLTHNSYKLYTIDFGLSVVWLFGLERLISRYNSHDTVGHFSTKMF